MADCPLCDTGHAGSLPQSEKPSLYADVDCPTCSAKAGEGCTEEGEQIYGLKLSGVGMHSVERAPTVHVKRIEAHSVAHQAEFEVLIDREPCSSMKIRVKGSTEPLMARFSNKALEDLGKKSLRLAGPNDLEKRQHYDDDGMCNICGGFFGTGCSG